MSPKPPLPPIDLAPKPAAKPNLSSLPRRALDDDTIEANSRAVGQTWGASTQLPGPAAPPARTARLNLVIPGYLEDQLKDVAHAKRSTVTSVILEALHKAGYQVAPEDLVPDKRRRRI